MNQNKSEFAVIAECATTVHEHCLALAYHIEMANEIDDLLRTSSRRFGGPYSSQLSVSLGGHGAASFAHQYVVISLQYAGYHGKVEDAGEVMTRISASARALSLGVNFIDSLVIRPTHQRRLVEKVESCAREKAGHWEYVPKGPDDGRGQQAMAHETGQLPEAWKKV